MTYAWDNDSTQNAHIKQMRDDRQKAYMEKHCLKNGCYKRGGHRVTQKRIYNIRYRERVALWI